MLAASVQVGPLVPLSVVPEPASSKRMPHKGKCTSVEKTAKDCAPEPALDLTTSTYSTSLEWSQRIVVLQSGRIASMPAHDNRQVLRDAGDVLRDMRVNRIYFNG